MCIFTSDHNLGRTTLSGLEVGGGGNKGSRPELPVGLRHTGDGGPRRRALPAGRRLFHSAAASGRNLLMIPHVKKKMFTPHVYFPSFECLICCWTPVTFCWNAIEVEPWDTCAASMQLFLSFSFFFLTIDSNLRVCVCLYTDLCAFMPGARVCPWCLNY